MVYDTRGHIPQVIEEMRQDFKDGNIDGLENHRIFIGQIYPEMVNVFDSYEKERNKRIQGEWKQYIKSITNAVNGDSMKNLDDFNVNVTNIQNNLLRAVNKHEKDYWETIMGSTIRRNNKDYHEILKQQETETADV